MKLAKAKFAAGLKSQGKHLCKMISTALTIIGDDKRWEEAMVQLTTVHCHRGTRAVECESHTAHHVICDCEEDRMIFHIAVWHTFFT
jgi:hypothetical protein